MNRQGKIIASFIIALIVVIFALLNSQSVPISLGFTEVHAPLIIIIIGGVILGALILFLTSSTSLWRNKKEIKKLTKELSSVKEQYEQKLIVEKAKWMEENVKSPEPTKPSTMTLEEPEVEIIEPDETTKEKSE